MYKLLRNILFLWDAEKVHYFSMIFLKAICKISFIKKIITKIYSAKNISTKVFGLHFKNPVGLGAGFDKNAKYLTELETLGFGFVEIGTVTPLPQKGNDRPRLFRLPKDKALINRMGFNNEGVDEVIANLKKFRIQNREVRIIIGGNIGKNKLTPNEDAWKDYETCFEKLFDWVDYFVVNVSSPNTPGLRELQQKDSLHKILSALQKINQQKEKPKPLLFKISPDMNWQEIDDVIELSIELNLDGIVAANTTLSRENLLSSKEKINKIDAGGLSGIPLQKISTDIVQYIADKTNHQLAVIASGGVFKGEDAIQKINAGATLVQVWTGFIYEGPSIVKNICNSLSYLHQ